MAIAIPHLILFLGKIDDLARVTQYQLIRLFLSLFKIIQSGVAFHGTAGRIHLPFQQAPGQGAAFVQILTRYEPYLILA
jgi:hypothetical protein